ncbi:hypothetical protein PENTCL1PPCAC_18564, partial [Pristionchus entomophagus]
HRLILFVFPLAMAGNVIFDEMAEFVAHEEYFELTCLQEKSELAIDDFFIQYPTLKPSSRADIITLKRSFVKFIDMEREDQLKIIGGGWTEHDVLAHFIQGLKEFAREEYKQLNSEEKNFVGGMDDWVEHKLALQPALKDIRQKKADFLVSGLSMEEFAAEVMRKGATIAHKWDMDPSYEKMEEASQTPEFEAAFRAWEEKKEKGGDEILSIHIDHQTNEMNFDTIKINKDKHNEEL